MKISLLFVYFIFCLNFFPLIGFGQERPDYEDPTIYISNPYREDYTVVIESDSIYRPQKNTEYDFYGILFERNFNPQRGETIDVIQNDSIVKYDSYVSLSIGSFESINLRAHTGVSLKKNHAFQFSLTHHSSQAEISLSGLPNNFLTTELTTNYKNTQLKNYVINGGVLFSHQLFNWYGLPIDTLDTASLKDLNPKQNYYDFKVQGDISPLNSRHFKGSSLELETTGDAFGTLETIFKVSSAFTLNPSEEEISIKTSLNHHNTSFSENPFVYGDTQFFNSFIEIIPTFNLKKYNTSFNIGAVLLYDLGNSSLSFYPLINASYRLVKDFFIPYVNLIGGKSFTTYTDLQKTNPYIAPNIDIKPKETPYTFEAGIKGKFSPKIGYNTKVSFGDVNDHPFYRLSPFLSDNQKDYTNGNSFIIVYDNIRFFNVYGELNFDYEEVLQLLLNIEVVNYFLEKETSPWNIPKIKGSLFANYKVDKNWYANTSLYFVGQRTDISFSKDTDASSTLDIDAYFDINLHLGYEFNKTTSLYVKLNNISGNSYQKWANYNVYPTQVLLGASYKF